MSSRPLIFVILLVGAIVVASWALGELLRQRKEDQKRRRKGRR
jgi:hypothetical protein